MAKDLKQRSVGEEEGTESEALEIIELAIDDLDLLTRAFTIISDACAENPDPLVEAGEIPGKLLLN